MATTTSSGRLAYSHTISCARVALLLDDKIWTLLLSPVSETFLAPIGFAIESVSYFALALLHTFAVFIANLVGGAFFFFPNCPPKCEISFASIVLVTIVT